MTVIKLFVLAACLLQNQTAPKTSVILDGEFDEWMTRPPTIVDPADASTAFIDFGEVRVLHDLKFVHMQADFGNTVNAQGLEGTAMVVLDADGDATTGKTEHGLDGVDIIVDLSPRGRKSMKHEGVGLRSMTYEADANDPAKPFLNPYDIGFAFAPTHAGRRFEFRFERGAALPNTPPLFQGQQFSGKFVFVDPSGALADETPVFTHKLLAIDADPIEVKPDEANPLEKPDAGAIRLVSWNIQRGAIFKQPELFGRILRALQPDVIHLQELSEHNSAAQLQEFLKATFSDDQRQPWNVAFGEGGGDLRCAVASRHPLALSPALRIVPMPQRPDHSVRTIGAIAEIDNHSILLVSLHLKCCGRAGGPEDEQRLNEVDAIHTAVKSALAAQQIDGALISGDFNLVGSRDPLEALATNLDVNRSSLAVPQTYQLDGLSNATWSDPFQPFIPGRLDYILVSDSSIEVMRGFVLDTRDLGPTWLERCKLQAEDTATASDHLPVVIDFKFRKP
jgi:endonuclease/exonuclease/phosphatase family metal-dependent hydrolase